MASGRIPYAGRRNDPYQREIWQMMRAQMDADQRFYEGERARSAAKWDAVGNLGAMIEGSYRGFKDRERAEADRQMAIDRQESLDDIASEARAQASRDLAYSVGRQRVEDVEEQDESVIAASLGDMVRTVLPDPPPPGTPLYLPNMPLTDPRREARAGPRQLTPSQGIPQGKPLAYIAEIPSRLEGQTESIPIETAQGIKRKGLLEREEKIVIDAQDAERAAERELRFAAREREDEAAFKAENPDVDVVFFNRTDRDGNITRVAINAETLEELGTFDAGVNYQYPPGDRSPSQTSMLDQAKVGFGRVLAGEDPGKFSYEILAGSVTDPRHLEARLESYREIDSPAYKSHVAQRLADNPEMKALTKERDSRFNLDLVGEEKEALEAFEQEGRQIYLDALDRYITGEGQGVVGASQDGQQGLYFTDPETMERMPISADVVSRLGLKPGEEFELPTGQVVTALEWPQDIYLGGEVPR